MSTSPLSPLDADQVVRSSYDDNAGLMMATDGFILKAVGRKVVVTYPTSTTEVYTYKQGSTTLFEITVTYTDSTKASISQTERTA